MPTAPTTTAPLPTVAPLARVERILVVVLRHLGDVLLTTPALSALKRHYPQAELVVCVNAGTEEMLAGNPDIDRILTVRRKSSAIDLAGRLREARLLLEVRRMKFDLAIDLTSSDRSAILAAASGARHCWGYQSRKGFAGRRLLFSGLAPREGKEHVILRHLKLLEAFGIPAGEPRLRFAVSRSDREAVDALVPPRRRILQVHPVSRIAKKNWPAPFLAELLEAIQPHGLFPVLTGSNDPVERDWVHGLCRGLKVPHLDLCGRLSLKQLGALSERAVCFLGVDTAPMHIAAALNRPVIAFFGPTSETLWAPWCDRRVVLSRDLSCRLPCKDPKYCPHIECLRAFTPAMVLPQVDAFLRSL